MYEGLEPEISLGNLVVLGLFAATVITVVAGVAVVKRFSARLG